MNVSEEPVPILLRGELEIETDALPEQALELIKAALSFPNEDKETAAREQVQGWWSMPDTLDLWRVEDRRDGRTVIVMPRGFALQLGQIFANLGKRYSFDDQRVAPRAAEGYFRPFVLRDYQLEAATAILKAQQGGLQVPGGGGKTVIALGAMAYAGLRAFVIVDKADLVDQWRERAEEFLGLSTDFSDERSTGKIGMDVWEERDLTIALRQTLWSRIDQLDATHWWRGWGFTEFDEHHHVAADTLAEVSRRCISLVMGGLSATPARTPTKGRVVAALIGPIVHRVEREVLRDKGVLVKPSVRRITTSFEHPFWPTHKVDAGENCEKPDCRKQTKHGHRNNYSSVVSKLSTDEARNGLIAQQVVSERGHVHLIPSRRLKQLDALKKALEAAGWDGPIFYLRGEENARGESRGIVEQVMSGGEAVVLSTIADEALDVPPIDRVHLVWPMRQSAATEQIVGRAERTWQGKQDAIILDYLDERTEVLLNQSYERYETYERLKLEIEREEPVRFDSGDFSSFSIQWPIVVAHPINGQDINVPTREHLYQAMKTLDQQEFDWVMTAPTAVEAKKRGQGVTLRDGWDDGVSFGVMRSIIRDQCDTHSELAAKLKATGRRQIIEARPDPIWGEGPDGQGQNLLGKAWMEVRGSLR